MPRGSVRCGPHVPGATGSEAAGSERGGNAGTQDGGSASTATPLAGPGPLTEALGPQLRARGSRSGGHSPD